MLTNYDKMELKEQIIEAVLDYVGGSDKIDIAVLDLILDKVLSGGSKRDVEEVYSLYPARCLVSGRSSGKTLKHKDKIKILLKKHTPKELKDMIRWYCDDCKRTTTFMKNFGTFLNNLPDIPKAKVRESLPPRPPEDSLKPGQVIDFGENGKAYRMKKLPDNGKVVVIPLSFT